MMEIFSITTNLSRYGGAQKVMVDVHNGLKRKYDAKILGFQKYEDLHQKYCIEQNEYVQLKSPWQLKNKIIIVHARNIIPIIVLLKTFFLLNTKIIYVSHNVYNNYKYLTLFPKYIVSISNKVTENLVDFFKVNNKKITLIYNGIEDRYSAENNNYYNRNGKIKILYPARVNSIKRQLTIVKALKNDLHKNIEIHFAGIGTDYPELCRECNETSNFKALGFVENIDELIEKFDYLMLFSSQEGLPISLLEGIMHSKPLLVNDVGGNTEIGVPSKNGILLQDDWNLLATTLNGLLNVDPEKYLEMSRASRKIFVEKFTVEKMNQQYIKLIQAVLKE